MSMPSCNTCLFFKPGTTDAFPKSDGMCRRFAPQGPVIGSHTNGWQVFPPMMAHQWCGDFRLDPHHLSAQAMVA